MPSPHARGNILGTTISITNHQKAIAEVFSLATRNAPSYVCFATAHMLVEAVKNAAIRDAYDRATLVTPDGTPVAWGLRMLGYREANCVSGPRLVPLLLQEAERRGIPVGFFGGRSETLEKMRATLAVEIPNLQIAYIHSPPFRPMTDEENQQVLQDIRDSGAKLVLVGLGSPKQELWMHRNSTSLPCVLLGVGAVFEFLSGEKYLPPQWVQSLGLTWLVRLCQEPRRLLRRNLVYSPVFILRLMGQVVGTFGRTEAQR